MSSTINHVWSVIHEIKFVHLFIITNLFIQFCLILNEIFYGTSTMVFKVMASKLAQRV